MAGLIGSGYARWLEEKRAERAAFRQEALRRLQGGHALDPVTGRPLHGPGGQAPPPERGLEVHQEVAGPAPDLVPGGPAAKTRPVLGPDYASVMAEAQAAGLDTAARRAVLERRLREGRVNPAWGESEDEPLFLPPIPAEDAEEHERAAREATAGWGEMDRAPSASRRMAGELGRALHGGFGPAGRRAFEPGMRDGEGSSAEPEAGFGGGFQAARNGGHGARGAAQPIRAGAAPPERWGLLDVWPDLQPPLSRNDAQRGAPAMAPAGLLSGSSAYPDGAPLSHGAGGWLNPVRPTGIDPASQPRTVAHMRGVSQALGGPAISGGASGYGAPRTPSYYPLPLGRPGVSGQADVFRAYGAEVLAGGSGGDRLALRGSTASGGPVRRLPFGSAGAWPGPIGDPGERGMRGGLATGFAAATGAAGQWDGPPLRGKQRPQPLSPAGARQLGSRESLPARGAPPSPTDGPSRQRSGPQQRSFAFWPVQGYYELNKKDKEDEGDGIFDAPRDGGRKHRGIDISGPLGTPILAVAEGVVVIRSTDKGGYGRQVVIDHGNGFFTQYGHLEENDVPPAPGTRVRAGDIIGTLGRSGNTPRKGDPHLHFEVRLGSPWAKARVEDPLKYLPPRPARRANGS